MSTGPPKCSVCLNHIILGPGELIYTCLHDGGCAEGVYCELCVNNPQFTECAICRGPKDAICINRQATIHIGENASLECADCDEAVLWKDAFSHEKAHMMDRVKEDGSVILEMRKIYQNDRKIVLLAVAQNGMVLKDLSDQMKNDDEIISKALANNGLVLPLLPPLVQENESYALAAVRENWLVIRKLRLCHSTNPKVILEGVKGHPVALRFADVSLKKNIDFVLSALMRDPQALRYAHVSMKTNWDVFRTATLQDKGGTIFRDLATDEFKMDHNIVEIVLKRNGMMLEHVADSLKADSKFVWMAICENPEAIQFAQISDEGTCTEMYSACVQKDGTVLRFAPSYIRTFENIIFDAVRQNGNALKFAHSSLKKDRKIVLAAVEQCGTALQFAASCFLKDPEVLCRAASNDVSSLQFANQEFMVKLLREHQNRDASSLNHKRKRPRREAPGESTESESEGNDDDHLKCVCGGQRQLYRKCSGCGHYNHVRRVACEYCPGGTGKK